MKVLKILNNNFILVKNAKGQEEIIMGRGLRFKTQVGGCLEEKDVERRFVSGQGGILKDYSRMIEEIPLETLEVIQEAVDTAGSSLSCALDSQAFFTLLDHLIYAMERCQKGIVLQNRLLWEVKKFYPREYRAGKDAVDYLNQRLGLKLPEEEAGNIAFHLVNAQTEGMTMERTMSSVKMVKDILTVVQFHMKKELDTESLYFSRFVTHLQFFVQRLLEGRMLEEKDSFLYEQISRQYPNELEAAMKISGYVETSTKTAITREEILYLTIHITRVFR